jgi:type I restriction enzyme M protein
MLRGEICPRRSRSTPLRRRRRTGLLTVSSSLAAADATSGRAAYARSAAAGYPRRILQPTPVSHRMPETLSNLSIPDDRVVDYIDGTLRKKTPEEYVRQNIERSFVLEYQYPRDEIAVEFPIRVGSSRRRVDLVVFEEGKKAEQANAVIVCETKKASTSPQSKSEGIAQLQSYMAACLNARFGIWTNGDDRYCFEKVGETEGEWVFHEVVDIPIKGQPPNEADRPRRDRLKPAVGDNLLFALRRCHNYIAGNEGLQKPEAFWELLKLIFCKIEDERSSDLTFYVASRERQSPQGQAKVKRRIGQIFERSVRDKYPAIFRPTDEIGMQARVIAFVVAQLQGYSALLSVWG